MELSEARKIVTEYQKWRKGKFLKKIQYNIPPTIDQVTQAIDTLLAVTAVTDEMVERACIAFTKEYLINVYGEACSYHELGCAQASFEHAIEAALQAALGGGE